jgi:hypothetical protein
MSGWEWYWLAFLLIGFGVPEAIALARREKGDTLSESVWKWFAIRKGKGHFKWARRGVLALFLGWLTVHFLTGGLI